MFEIVDNILIKYNGDDKEVIIPDGVTTIGKGAFENLKITSVIIPNSVKVIEDNAFKNCHHLGKVTMPEDVTVRESSFEDTLFSRVNYNLGKCRYCGGETTGLFVKSCKRCGRKQPIF